MNESMGNDMKKSKRFRWSVCSGNTWSICVGNRWSICSETGGQFKLKVGGQFHRFFHKTSGDQQNILTFKKRPDLWRISKIKTFVASISGATDPEIEKTEILFPSAINCFIGLWKSLSPLHGVRRNLWEPSFHQIGKSCQTPSAQHGRCLLLVEITHRVSLMAGRCQRQCSPILPSALNSMKVSTYTHRYREA